MFVETQDINARELRDEIAEANQGARLRPVRLRVVHDADREREAQAIILRLLLSERPAELRIEAVTARIGQAKLAARAIEALVDAGLVIRIDEYVLATAVAVKLHRLLPFASRSSEGPGAAARSF